jgi:hypothetical protein
MRRAGVGQCSQVSPRLPQKSHERPTGSPKRASPKRSEQLWMLDSSRGLPRVEKEIANCLPWECCFRVLICLAVSSCWPDERLCSRCFLLCVCQKLYVSGHQVFGELAHPVAGVLHRCFALSNTLRHGECALRASAGCSCSV